jgi:NAD-dependent SIR2 family protein deacetylase
MTKKNKVLLLLAIPVVFVCAYLVLSYLYPPNMLLEKPEHAIFTKEDRLQRDWRRGDFHSSDNEHKMCIYFQEKFDDHKNYYFIATYFGSLPKELSENHKKLFQHESRIIGGKAIDLYSYATGTLKDPDRWLPIYDETLETTLSKSPENLTNQLALPLNFLKKGEKTNPQKISEQECATLLKNKRFLFYTGAGLSAAAGIKTGVQLRKEIGLDETKKIDQFTMNILTNPQAIIDVHEKFEESFKHIEPTPAHISIANLAMKHNAHVVTSNIDKLHEQTGVKAWNIMSKHTCNFLLWEQPIPESGNFTYLEANPQWLKNIDFVICIGMSTDVEGFLAWYKKHNPQGKIIAINRDMVPYLGDEDYFLQGDAQEILPAVEGELS